MLFSTPCCSVFLCYFTHVGCFNVSAELNFVGMYNVIYGNLSFPLQMFHNKRLVKKLCYTEPFLFFFRKVKKSGVLQENV